LNTPGLTAAATGGAPWFADACKDGVAAAALTFCVCIAVGGMWRCWAIWVC
jgi:hypothetical protein